VLVDPFRVTAQVSEAGAVAVSGPVRLTPAVTPEARPVPAVSVTISEGYMPPTVVLVSPVTWIETVVPGRSDVREMPEKVIVVPDSDTDSSRNAGLTVPSAAVPAVPGGTVIVADVMMPSNDVVNVYV
jgi:hypothetical protein